MRPRSLRFATRLGIASAVVVALVCVGLSWAIARGALAHLRTHLTQRGAGVATTLAREAATALQRGDLDALAEAAERAQVQGDVSGVRVFDPRGFVLATSGTPAGAMPALDALPTAPVDDGDTVDLWQPIAPERRSGDPLGAVAVRVSLAPLDELRMRVLATAALLTVLFVVAGALAAGLVARTMALPLGDVARATAAVAAGDFSARVAVPRDDELGTVAASFNAMAESLARSHRAVEAHVRELEQANHLKSEFLATVSHELRTPLNVIIGNAEMLDDPGSLSASEHARLLGTIRRYAELQLDLVTSVLDFERLASGEVACRVEPFALAPLVDDVVALQAARVRPGVQLVAHVAPDCPTLESDRIKVHQILRNLVDNAVKFTESGRIVIEAGPGPTPDHVVVAVTDTGPGIPPEDLPHVFEPFRQSGASSTRRTNGVGLGLSIVRQLVEVLGGEVRVSSEPGWGSTFRVEVPRVLTGRASAAVEPGARVAPRAA